MALSQIYQKALEYSLQNFSLFHQFFQLHSQWHYTINREFRSTTYIANSLFLKALFQPSPEDYSLLRFLLVHSILEFFLLNYLTSVESFYF